MTASLSFTVDLVDFRAVAEKATSGAVQAVKNAEQEIRDALIDTIAALHSKHDDVSEAVRYILGKVISKRSTDGKESLLPCGLIHRNKTGTLYL